MLVNYYIFIFRSSSSGRACLNTVNDNNEEQYYISNSADKTDDSVDEIYNSDNTNIEPLRQSLIIKVPKTLVSHTKTSFISPLKAKENINQVPSKRVKIISDIIVKPAYQQQDIHKQAKKLSPCARVDIENTSSELSKNSLKLTCQSRAVLSQCANIGEEMNFSPRTTKDMMDSISVLTCQTPMVSPSIIADVEINIFPKTDHDLPDSVPQLTCLKPMLLPSAITDVEINTIKDSVPELTCLTPVLLPSVITDVEINVFPGTSATTLDDVFQHTYRTPANSSLSPPVIVDIETNVSPTR